MTEPSDAEVPLPIWGSGGQRIVAWARVSREDWEWARSFRWWLSDGYVCRSLEIQGRKTTIALHREIAGLQPGDPREVDHADRDRLNNTRTNLRIVTRAENERNKPTGVTSSRHRGVTYDRRTGRWKAQASHEGRYVYLGVFDSEEAAAAARAVWEQETRGPPDLSRFLGSRGRTEP